MGILNAVENKHETRRPGLRQDLLDTERGHFGDVADNTLMPIASRFTIQPRPFLDGHPYVFLPAEIEDLSDAGVLLSALDAHLLYITRIQGFENSMDSIRYRHIVQEEVSPLQGA